MGKSSRLPLGDVRRAFRLLGDCRDLGHDRAAWMRRAIAGLRGELGAYLTVGVFIEAPLAPFARPGLSLFDDGWETDRDREIWLALHRAGKVLEHPTVRAIYELPAVGVTVRSRDQLVSDRTWRRSDERNEHRGPLHQDETLIGMSWHGGPGGAHAAFSINRAVGERPFCARERALLRLFTREVHALSGKALTVDESGPFAGLTPRAREVLDALVEGDAEKQIASRLGVSRHTIHDYVKALYRRFDVASRGELLAFYYRSQRPT